MAYSTINKPEDYFNTKLYTGNGSTQSITGVGFQPDWVWIKHRNNSTAYNHRAYDAVRGATKNLAPNATDAEITSSTELTSFDSDGFTLGSADPANQNTVNHVSWNWLGANGTSSNTDGSITSTVSANTTSGFSIVSYTGTGSAATVGHGLGVAPAMYIVKNREAAQEWTCYNKNIGATKYIDLNATTQAVTFNMWQDTDPTSSVFSINTHARVNSSGVGYIAYCFAEKKGFSKFGTFTGNGNADGTFVYTGFRPAWVMWKRTDSATNANWVMMDNKRTSSDGNVTNQYMFADSSQAEGTAAVQDHLSNGFKFRLTDGTTNASGATYIYMAFAERSLVGTNNIPALAR